MGGFTRMVSIAFGLLTVYNYRAIEAATKAGPFDIDIKKIEQCENGGTGEIYFGNRMSSKGNHLYTYTNMVTFNVPWDETITMDVEAQKLSNGIYRPRYITQAFKGCRKAFATLKDWMTEFFGAAGYEFKECPMPAGNYSVTDWVVGLKIKSIPTMIYSSYKLIVAYIKDGKRLGCWTVYADVIPKQS